MALQPYLNRTKGPFLMQQKNRNIDSEYRFGRNDGSRNSVTKPRNGIPGCHLIYLQNGRVFILSNTRLCYRMKYEMVTGEVETAAFSGCHFDESVECEKAFVRNSNGSGKGKPLTGTRLQEIQHMGKGSRSRNDGSGSLER